MKKTTFLKNAIFTMVLFFTMTLSAQFGGKESIFQDTTAPTTIAQDAGVQLYANEYFEIIASQVNSGWSNDSGKVSLSVDKTSFDSDDLGASIANNFALNFDGTNDYVSLDMSYSSSGAISKLTVEAWVNTSENISGTWDNWAIIDFDRSEYYNLYITGKGQVGFSTTGSNKSTNDFYSGSSNVVNDGQWHHITAVFDGNDKIIYINGVEVAREKNPHGGRSIGSGKTRFGIIGDGSEAVSYNGGRNNIYYKGSVDELRIWNVVRTPAEIQANMNFILSGLEAGLVAYYDMEEGTGTTLSDRTGNGNNGTLHNMNPSTDWVAGADGLSSAADETAPTAIAQNVTVQLNGDGNGTITAAQVNNGSTDNSGGILTYALDQTTFNCNNLNVSSSQDNLSLFFDGVDDYVTLDQATQYVTSTNFTVEFWMNGLTANNTGGFGGRQMFSLHTSSGGNKIRIGLWGSESGVINLNDQPSGGSIQIGDGNWHHIALVYDGINYSVYVDGTLDYKQVGNANGDPNWLASDISSLGQEWDGGNTSDFFKGGLDEVRIWNVARTQAQIQANQSTNLSGTENDLVAYYQFDDGAGSTSLIDATGNGANGSLSSTMDASTSWVDGATALANGNVVNLTVTDASNNSSTATANVTVEDNIAPAISAPADITNVYATSAQGAVVNYTTPVGTDNCSVTTAMTAGLVDGATFPIGTTVVTYVATDGSGHTASASFNVVVIGVAPVIISADGATEFCPNESVTLSSDSFGTTTSIDGVTTSPTMAVGMRKLIASYAGPAIRLRRASDNAEQDFGFSGTDLDLNAINTFLGSSAAFATILYDQSGGGNHFSQTTQSTQPLFSANGFNGKPMLNTTNSKIMLSPVNMVSQFTVIYGARQQGPARGRMLSGVNNNWLLGWWQGGKSKFYSAGWVLNAAGGSGGTYVYSGTGSQTTDQYSIYENGVHLATNNGGSQGPNGLSIGAWSNNGSEPSDGYFTDLVAYSSVLSKTDRELVENSIGAYYGIFSSSSEGSQASADLQWQKNGVDISGATNGEYSTSASGSYTLEATFNGYPVISDAIVVTVKDNIDPTVNLNGAATIALNQNETYTETATADDNCSANLVITGTVDTATAGVYTLTYKATDGLGNVSNQITRTVIIAPVDQPLTATDASVCAGSGTTITTASSESGVNYSLYDSNDNLIDGPTSGTGSALPFNTGNLTSATDFYVEATSAVTALDFDGNNDYVSVPHSSSIHHTNDATFEFWTNLDVNENAMFFSKFNIWRNDGFYINYYGGRMTYSEGHGGTVGQTSISSIPIGRWVHVAITKSSNIIKFYYDGVLQNPGGSNIGYTSTVASSTAMIIGNTADNSQSINGRMDEVRIWNVVKSEAEIQAGMTRILSGSETNLMAYYDFEDGSGTTLTDKTSNGNNGTLINMDGNTDWVTGYGASGSAYSVISASNVSVSISTIVDQALTATDATVCSGTATTITTASSESGVNYSLYEATGNTAVDGPTAGTGSALTFSTGNLTTATDFYVKGETTQSISNTAGTALNFDGSDDEIFTSIDLGANATLEFWINPNTTTNNQRLISGNTNTGTASLWFNNNKIGIWATCGGWTDITTSTIPTNAWTHVAVAFSGSQLFTYINGTLETTLSCTGTFYNDLAISSTYLNNGTRFNGLIDEVQCWNVLRDASDISSDMNTPLTGSEAGLTAYFNFETGSGTSAIDLTGTYTSSILGGATWVSGVGASGAACSVTSASNVSVGVSTASFSFAQDTITSCGEDSVIVDAGSGWASYAWSNGETTQTNTIYTSGTYELTVTDNNGCTYSDSIVVSVINGSIIQNDTTICSGNSVSLSINDNPYIPTNGLLMYYPFNGNANDESGNGKNGTAVENASYTSSGKYGGGFSLDGSGDYIDAGSNSITGPSPFTLGAWINTKVINKYTGAISIGSSGNGNSAYIGTVAGAQVGTGNSIGGGFYGANYGSGITTTNDWVHVVLTFAGGSNGAVKLYVNGNVTVTTTYTPNLTSGKTSIGRIGTSGYHFDGLVDNTVIYDRALSDSEIQSLYLGNSSGNTLSYLWSTGETTSTITVNPTTTTSYLVTTTDGISSCEDTVTLSVNNIIDQAITATEASVCPGSETTVTTASSETGVNYTLYDTSNNLIDGPTAGTGSSLSFNTGNLSAVTDFYLQGINEAGCIVNSATNISVTVVDNQAPIITLNGAETVNHNAYTLYTDESASATDNCGTPNVSVGGDVVDVNTVGTYVITYDAVDTSNNPANQVTRTVVVQDTTNPIAIAQDITVELNASGQATITTDDINNGSSDDSGDNLTYTVSPNTFDCNSAGGSVSNSSSLSFDGTGSAATPSLNELNITGDLTLESWFTVSEATGSILRITGKGGQWDRNYGLWHITRPNGIDDIYFEHYSPSNNAAGGASVRFQTNILVNQWYHIAAVRDGNTVKLYLDGVLVNTNTINGISSTSSQPFTIGAHPRFAALTHKGQIDEVRLWNIARTDQEIADSFNVGLEGTEAGLIAYYNMNAGIGSTLVDVTGGNDATFTGAAWSTDVPVVNSIQNEVEVTLTVTDESNNISTTTANVTIEDNIAPSITINGAASIDHDAFTDYTDLGATTADNCSATLVTTDDINTDTPGTYTVKYTATDGSDNVTITTRTVVVQDTTHPIAIAQDITVELNASGQATITTDDINNGSSDDSDGTLTYELDQTTFDCEDLGGNNYSLDFNGSGSHVNLGNGLNFTSDFAVETWLNISNIPTTVTRIIENDYITGYLLGLYGDGTITVYINNVGYVTTSKISLNTWTHLAFSYTASNNNLKVFKDGIEILSRTTGNITGNSKPTLLSKYYGGTGWGFNGLMDEVRFWNVPKTAADITQSMNSALSGNEIGLVAYYNFEGGKGSSILTDQTGNGNTGALISMDVNSDYANGLTPFSSIGNQVTLTVTDESNNISTTTANVTVEDTINPEITAPDNISIYATSADGAVVNYTTPVGTDNCTVTTAMTAGLADGATFPIGTTVVTYTATDAYGNTASASFNVELRKILQ